MTKPTDLDKQIDKILRDYFAPHYGTEGAVQDIKSIIAKAQTEHLDKIWGECVDHSAILGGCRAIELEKLQIILNNSELNKEVDK